MVGPTAVYSGDTPTSPIENHSQWEYAVPLGRDSVDDYTKSLSSRDSNSLQGKFTKDCTSNLPQGSSLSKNPSKNLGSIRGRRDYTLNQNGGETGSVRGVYGTETNAWSDNIRKSWDSTRFRTSFEKGDTAVDNVSLSEKDDPDSAHWIHRDKLARIESEELHQAAILYQRRFRSEKRRTGSRERGHESRGSGVNGSSVAPLVLADQMEPWPSLSEEQQEYSEPTVLSGDRVNGEPAPEDQQNCDLQDKPFENAAEERPQEDGASGVYRNPGLRKSSSRIPIATPSRLPVSSGRLGRDTPTQRDRTSTSESDTGTSSTKPRRYSEPLSLDPAESSKTSSSAPSGGSRPGSRGMQSQNSPAKKPSPKNGNGATPNSTNRKASAATGNRKVSSRTRTASGSNGQSLSRPAKSGDRIINRPEGDPPWLATMYKPDPRLPPEQQILPTHARRMQQEKWEREGRTPITYDREFAPLAITQDEGKPIKNETKAEARTAAEEKTEPEEPKEKQEKQEQPSSTSAPPSSETPQAPKSPDPNSRPTTSSGYRTIPRLQSTPTPAMGRIPSRNPNVTTPVQAPVQDEGKIEKKKSKDGCGCCIVM